MVSNCKFANIMWSSDILFSGPKNCIHNKISSDYQIKFELKKFIHEE